LSAVKFSTILSTTTKLEIIMKKLIIMLAVSFLGIAGATQAASPLVDVAWITANTGKAEIVYLDFRRNAAYLRGHIPGAIHSNYGKDGWREKNSDGTIGMIPSAEKLAVLIGGLGIGNGDHVVLLPAGNSSSDMGVGTRVYWTFKVLGHDEVSILNGGMNAYKKAKAKLEKGLVKRDPKTFSTRWRSKMVVTKAQVKKALDTGVTLVDSRTYDQYVGLNKHPKAKRKGTITGAVVLPQNWLTVGGKGTFRSNAELKKLYVASGVPTSGEQITFCNTGHWASIDWFVGSELVGNNQTQMYDGSMVEWTADASLPIEQKINY
jgi:thiosulfate/3-mercaptopyruvate sulfurtransferase